MSWKKEIDELRKRESLAEKMGGKEKLKRQKDNNRLNVRERINLLLDKNSFHEFGKIAGKAEYDENGELRGFIGGFNDVDNFLKETDDLGIKFVILKEPIEISKNLYLSGPVERIHERVVVSPGFYLKKDGLLLDDLVLDDQSLGILTKQGWYMMSGCGHAGMINTAQKFKSIQNRDVIGAIGGFHLFRSSDEVVTKTALALKEFGLKQLVGGHCTGIHEARKIADIVNIQNKNLSHGAIGTVVTKDLKIVRSSVE